jgi:hypothetical protein
MKKIIVCSLFLSIFNVNSQEWVRTIGGDSVDVVGSFSNPICVNNQGLIISSSSGSSFNGTINDPVNGDWDVFLHAHNQNGQLIQQKTFGGPGPDLGDFTALEDGQYLFLGRTSVSGGDVPNTLEGDEDIWIMLLDANFNIVWNKTYGGPGIDYPHSFHYDPTSHITHVYFQTESDTILGNINTGTSNLGILKLDGNGQLLNSFLLDCSDLGNGFTGSYGLDFVSNDFGHFLFGAVDNSLGNWNGFVVYLTNNFEIASSMIVDETSIGYPNLDFLSADISLNNQNEFFVLGERANMSGVEQFLSKLNFNISDSSLTFSTRHYLNSSLYNIWGIKSINTFGLNKAVVYGGDFQGNGLGIIFNEQLNMELDTFKLTGNENVYFWDVVDYNNNLIFIGNTQSNDTLFLNHGEMDVFLAKYNLDNWLNIEQKIDGEDILLYPNPTLGTVYFGEMIEKVEVYNFKGEKIKEMNFSSNVDLYEFSAGLYLFKFYRNNSLLCMKKIVKN